MSFLDFIYPKRCLDCNAHGRYVCISCLEKVGDKKSFCIVCKKPSIDGMTHSRCKTPWCLDRLVFLWPYNGVIRKAIVFLKYKYAEDMAKELASHVIAEIEKKDILFPKGVQMTSVPLHIKRKRWRGFNQSESIGVKIASVNGWRYDPNLLVKKKDTKPQAGLKGKSRKTNVQGAYKCTRKVKGNKIIIFDDVYTTGSTIKEIAKVLKRKGASEVYGLVIAS